MSEQRVVRKILALSIGVSFLLLLSGANHVEALFASGTSMVPIDYRCSNVGGMPAAEITYRSTLNFDLAFIVNWAVHNSIGQTLYHAASTLQIPSNGTATAYLILAGLPGGDYFVDARALTFSGVAISRQVTLVCSVRSAVAMVGPQTFTLAAPLEFCTPLSCDTPFVKATYRNNLNHTLTGVVYCILHNANGQTVYYTTATISPAGGMNATAYLVVAGLPYGTYYASVFATTPLGTVLSVTSLVGFSL